MSNQIPEDSILRRHYEQLQQAPKKASAAKSVNTEAATPAPQAAPATPPPRPAPASPSPAAGETSGGGILGWFKKLFG